MHVFEVWAPYARTVEVKIGNERFAMAGKERGWWSAEVSSCGAGHRLWIRDRWPGAGTSRSALAMAAERGAW